MIRNHAIEIWKAGVGAVHGQRLVEESVRLVDDQLTVNDQTLSLGDFDRILVVGGGKFSHFMAAGLERILGPEIGRQKGLSGLVTVPDGSNRQVQLTFIEAAECRPAGVNLPTERVVAETDRMLGMLGKCDARTLVIALISGGGSALIESSHLPLKTVIATTQWLSLRGADIIQLNKVRIAMSRVKGGGLVKEMPQGTMVSLIVSDVPGDDIRFVSSGPTVPYDSNAIEDAIEVFESFNGDSDRTIPDDVINAVAKSNFCNLPPAASVHNILVGNADVALKAASKKALELGYQLQEDCLHSTSTCEEVACAAVAFVDAATEGPQAVISLGEPTVTPGDGAGQGGRNQHAVLLAIRESLHRVNAERKFCILSGGTDGEDGNTSVAGATFCHSDIALATENDSEIDRCVKDFDSHTFLSQHGLVLDSGPTGTNVADLRVLLRGQVRPPHGKEP